MININLLPPELKMQRISAKRNASLIGLCVTLVIIFAILGIIARALESTFETYLSSAKNNIEKDTSGLEQYQDLQDLALLINDRWQTTQAIGKNRTIWSQVLQDLNNNAPSDVQFENLVIDNDKTPNFVLQGNTTTEREIIKFQDKLKASAYFDNVTFKSSSLSTSDTQKEQRLKFNLEFNLKKNTTYHMKFTSVADNNLIWINFIWYDLFTR